MKEGWKIEQLGNICTIVNGGTPSTSNNAYWRGNIQWLTPKDMGQISNKYVDKSERTISLEGIENSSAKILPKTSIILSSRAPIGYVAINTVPMATNQGCKGIIPSKRISSEYLYYFLVLSKELLNNLGTGATFKELSSKKLSNVSIPVPSLSEQQRIVELLDAEFAKIDTLKANAEKSLQNAKDLFQSALKKELTPKEGWKTAKLADVSTIKHGKNQKDVEDVNGKYPIYGSGGSIMGYANDFLCDEGTTILGRKGSINNPMFITTKFWNVDTAFGIVARNNCNKRFLFYFIKSINWIKYDTGTTLPSLTQKVVLNIDFPLPPLSEQHIISEKLDVLSENCQRLQSNYEKTIALCDDMKQALLRKAFNGEL